MNFQSSNFEHKSKMAPFKFSENVSRECAIANTSRMPYNYVPPPMFLELQKVPSGWPDEDDWAMDDFSFSHFPIQ